MYKGWRFGTLSGGAVVTTGSLLPLSWVVECRLDLLSGGLPGVIDKLSSEAVAEENNTGNQDSSFQKRSHIFSNFSLFSFFFVLIFMGTAKFFKWSLFHKGPGLEQ